MERLVKLLLHILAAPFKAQGKLLEMRYPNLMEEKAEHHQELLKD